MPVLWYNVREHMESEAAMEKGREEQCGEEIFLWNRWTEKAIT